MARIVEVNANGNQYDEVTITFALPRVTMAKYLDNGIARSHLGDEFVFALDDWVRKYTRGIVPRKGKWARHG